MGGRKREKHQCVVASCMRPTGDLACNPGMCPELEMNLWPFDSQVGTHTTEPHQPGLDFLFMEKLMTSICSTLCLWDLFIPFVSCLGFHYIQYHNNHQWTFRPFLFFSLNFVPMNKIRFDSKSPQMESLVPKAVTFCILTVVINLSSNKVVSIVTPASSV